MDTEIKVINLGGVNCYLLCADDRFVLVDSGFSDKREQLVKELEANGVQPGNLSLIILTHGDVDHVANAAYLRKTYSVRIAIHRADASMVEQGNMSQGRKNRPDKITFIGSLVILLGRLNTFFKSSPPEKFIPDLYLEDGQSLSEYGLDASVVHIPGHSKGSIGVLTSSNDLICGDLLWNMSKPGQHFLIDDLSDYQSTIRKLDKLKIQKVYPGHGEAFQWNDFKHR